MAGAIYSPGQNAIARALADARHQAGLKQTDLARLIGKHQSYVSDIERGQRRVDLLELYVLARAMNMDPTQLYAAVTKDISPDIQV